jgi:hypothetical protein
MLFGGLEGGGMLAGETLPGETLPGALSRPPPVVVLGGGGDDAVLGGIFRRAGGLLAGLASAAIEFFLRGGGSGTLGVDVGFAEDGRISARDFGGGRGGFDVTTGASAPSADVDIGSTETGSGSAEVSGIVGDSSRASSTLGVAACLK